MTEKRFHPPFRGELVSAEIPERELLQLQDEPESIVRVVKDNASFFLRSKEEVVRDAKREFDRLRDIYGVAVRAEYVLVGKDNDSARVYAITDRVYRDDPKDQETFEAQRETLLIALCRYFTGVAQSFDPDTGRTRSFMTDIVRYEEQFVYGHTAKDPEPKFRLVDIEPGEADDQLGSLYAVVEEMVHNEIAPLVAEKQRCGESIELLRLAVVDLLRALTVARETNRYSDESQYYDRMKDAVESVFNGFSR